MDTLHPGARTSSTEEALAKADLLCRSLRVDAATGYARPLSAGSTDDEVDAHQREVSQRVALAAHMLALSGATVRGARVLNVGASAGAEAIALLDLDAASVTATDGGEVYGDEAVTQHESALRNRVVARAIDRGVPVQRCRFLIDDITASALPDRSFDLIMSWQTLEHVADPVAAWLEMHRLLAPGGRMFHEYNPFFAIDGGHSPCTLETPWGHVCCTDEEMHAHLRRLRGAGAEAAMTFFRGGLNRMTQEELRAGLSAAGFEIELLLPRLRTEDLLRVTPQVLHAVTARYPGCTLMDLVCRIVRVVARRPGGFASGAG